MTACIRAFVFVTLSLGFLSASAAIEDDLIQEQQELLRRVGNPGGKAQLRETQHRCSGSAVLEELPSRNPLNFRPIVKIVFFFHGYPLVALYEHFHVATTVNHLSLARPAPCIYVKK